MLYIYRILCVFQQDLYVFYFVRWVMNYLLHGQRVKSEKLLQAGFQFQFKFIAGALEFLLDSQGK